MTSTFSETWGNSVSIAKGERVGAMRGGYFFIQKIGRAGCEFQVFVSHHVFTLQLALITHVAGLNEKEVLTIVKNRWRVHV